MLSENPMIKKLRGAVFGPCLGVGGGDSFMSSLIAHTWETIDWTGIFVGAGATPEQYERARHQTSGRVKFHQTNGTLAAKGGEKSRHAKYHSSPLKAAVAATKDADFVISWHCKHTAELAVLSEFKEVAFIELIQNENEMAQMVAQESLKYAYRCVAVSKKAGLETYGSESPFNVMPNGIEMDRILPRIGRKDARELWGIGEEEYVILFAGRLSDEKNPEAILDAMELLPNNYTALFVGNGRLEESIHDRAARSFDGRVRMLPSMHHLGDVYAVADVFVLVSDFEGDSLAWKEAMCAGLPCICSDVGSVRETVEASGRGTDSGFTTILKPRPTRYALSEAIKREFERSLERKHDSLQGEGAEINRLQQRSFALANFTISSVATGWAGYLTSVVTAWKKERSDFHRDMMFHKLQGTPILRIGEQRVQTGPNQPVLDELLVDNDRSEPSEEKYELKILNDIQDGKILFMTHWNKEYLSAANNLHTKGLANVSNLSTDSAGRNIKITNKGSEHLVFQTSGIEPGPDLEERVRESQGMAVDLGRELSSFELHVLETLGDGESHHLDNFIGSYLFAVGTLKLAGYVYATGKGVKILMAGKARLAEEQATGIDSDLGDEETETVTSEDLPL